MIYTNGYSRALFGGHLWGDKPLRFVFMDEAGTSALEPVTVIVGLVAEADTQVMTAEALALESLGAVPPHHKNSFVFHSAQVFGAKRYQTDWTITDRLNLLKAMMSVPRRVGMAIALSVHWRNAVDYNVDRYTRLGISKSQLEHAVAFQACVGLVDRNIRRHAGPREVATIVAEDVPEMRSVLKRIPRILRENPFHFLPEHLRKTVADDEAGYLTQGGEMRVSRIRNSVHFVEKDEDPLVQVADACAFGFRRYLAKEKFGEDFVDAILQDRSLLRNFAPPSGAECWWPKAQSLT